MFINLVYSDENNFFHAFFFQTFDSKDPCSFFLTLKFIHRPIKTNFSGIILMIHQMQLKEELLNGLKKQSLLLKNLHQKLLTHNSPQMK